MVSEIIITAGVLGGLGFMIWAEMKRKKSKAYLAITEAIANRKSKITKTNLPELPSVFTQEQKIM